MLTRQLWENFCQPFFFCSKHYWIEIIDYRDRFEYFSLGIFDRIKKFWRTFLRLASIWANGVTICSSCCLKMNQKWTQTKYIKSGLVECLTKNKMGWVELPVKEVRLIGAEWGRVGGLLDRIKLVKVAWAGRPRTVADEDGTRWRTLVRGRSHWHVVYE